MKNILLAIGFALFATQAFAAGAVQQSGTVTPGHSAMWTTNGVVQDGGPATAGNLTELGITKNGGLPFCINSGPITGAFNELCEGVSSSQAYITLQNYGGAPVIPLNFIINGAPYQFPFSLSGILGPNSSVVNDLSCWNNTIGSLLRDCSSATLPGTLTVNPSAGTLNQGVNITQSGPSSGGPAAPYSYNTITITGDDANGGDNVGNLTSSGLFVNMATGGSNMHGSRTAMFGQLTFTAQQNNLTSARDFSAATFYGLSSVNDGGTAIAPYGALWGMNPSAHLYSGATYWGSVSGGEVDIGIESGASAASRTGWDLASIGSVNGSLTDAALRVLGTNTSSWKNGLLLSAGDGGDPITASGCVICSEGSVGTITTGINLSAFTITGNFLNINGFTVTGAGALQGSTGIFQTTTPTILTLQTTGANNANFYINNAAGGQQDVINLSDAGTVKWSIIKQTNNDFIMYDTANAVNHYTTSAAGIVTIGEAAQISIPKTTSGLIINAFNSPASGAACTTGTINVDTNYLYVCTASGAWKRAALTGGY